MSKRFHGGYTSHRGSPKRILGHGSGWCVNGPALLYSGEIVTAAVRNPFEQRGSTGKVRCVVLLERLGASYRCMGLTAKSSFADGSPRTPVPNPTTVGLRGPGWLWGGRPISVDVLSIEDHVGTVDPALAFEVARAAGLSLDRQDELLSVALQYHGHFGVA